MAHVMVDKVRVFWPEHGPVEVAVHIAGEDFVKGFPRGPAAMDFVKRLGVTEFEQARIEKSDDGRTRLVEQTLPVDS